jgi:predicted adenine nucleotide alpha hydrolase (AANH) superfamily ATPase
MFSQSQTAEVYIEGQEDLWRLFRNSMTNYIDVMANKTRLKETVQRGNHRFDIRVDDLGKFRASNGTEYNMAQLVLDSPVKAINISEEIINTAVEHEGKLEHAKEYLGVGGSLIRFLRKRRRSKSLSEAAWETIS